MPGFPFRGTQDEKQKSKFKIGDVVIINDIRSAFSRFSSTKFTVLGNSDTALDYVKFIRLELDCGQFNLIKYQRLISEVKGYIGLFYKLKSFEDSSSKITLPEKYIKLSDFS